MPRIRVSVVLPYYLRLEEGEYQTSQHPPQAIFIGAPLLDERSPPRTPIRAQFEVADHEEDREIQLRRTRCAEQLLLQVNRLVRWYRSVSRRADIIELTRAQIGPFRFEAIGDTPAAAWLQPLEFDPTELPPAPLTAEQITAAVRNGLLSGNDPDVADLFLLDAQGALHQGRFRESVLFCWSTIDSVFCRRFNALIDATVPGEWASALEFIKGPEFGMRNKMSVGMRLVAQRSLFSEPDDLWAKLSSSYTKRNKIIHEGQNAIEDEAKQAIGVAQNIVRVMSEV